VTSFAIISPNWHELLRCVAQFAGWVPKTTSINRVLIRWKSRILWMEILEPIAESPAIANLMDGVFGTDKPKISRAEIARHVAHVLVQPFL